MERGGTIAPAPAAARRGADDVPAAYTQAQVRARLRKLGKITPDDLTDDDRAMGLYHRCIAAGMFGRAEADAIRYCAAVSKSLRVADKPHSYLAYLIGSGMIDSPALFRASDGDDQAGHARYKRLFQDSGP